MKVIKIPNGKLKTNSYVVYDESSLEAIVVDPADGYKLIVSQIEKHNLIPIYIVNTHGHPDHISGNKRLMAIYPDAKLAIHPADMEMLNDTDNFLAMYLGIEGEQPQPDLLLSEGDVIEFGGMKLQVLETPGHTEGSVSLYSAEYNILLSGDTLFHRSYGRTDLPGGNERKIIESLKRLFALPPETLVYAGHAEDTSIAYEMEQNPIAKRLG